MPALGFGTWRLWATAAYEPVRWALAAGYRHIDTAEGYANEAEVGRAIADSLVKREEIFIATKASSVPKGLADLSLAEQIFDFQLKQLGTDYVDVYMLHTPPVQPELLEPLWRVMEHFHRQGRARALGVSNCDVEDLKKIMSFASIPPAYIQNLFKIYKPGEQLSSSEDVVAFAQANGMVVVGYSVQTEWPHVMSPLADPHVLALSASLRRTPSQVLHRWALQRGVAVIPKSGSKQRIEENLKILDFELHEAAMQWLDGLATLSESGGGLKPYGQEDVFGLQQAHEPIQAPPQEVPSHSSDGSGPLGWDSMPWQVRGQRLPLPVYSWAPQAWLALSIEAITSWRPLMKGPSTVGSAACKSQAAPPGRCATSKRLGRMVPKPVARQAVRAAT